MRSRPPSSAATAPDQKTSPKTLATRKADPADQLLEVERVAVGQAREALDRRLGELVAEDVTHEPLDRAAAQLLEVDLVQAALGPEPREQLADLGARQRQHEQRPLSQ